MKKKVLILIALFYCIPLLSQESEQVENEIKKFGIGINILELKPSETQLSNSLYPSTKLILTYNHNNQFRIEPKIGLISIKTDDNKSSGYHFGLGTFMMTQKGKTNIYYGLSVGYDLLSTDKIIANSGNGGYGYISPFDISMKTKRLGIGPKIGGEFFLGKHFSLCGEIGVLYFATNTKQEGDGIYYEYEEEFKSTSISFDSGLIIRFYF